MKILYSVILLLSFISCHEDVFQYSCDPVLNEMITNHLAEYAQYTIKEISATDIKAQRDGCSLSSDDCSESSVCKPADCSQSSGCGGGGDKLRRWLSIKKLVWNLIIDFRVIKILK